MTDIPAKQTLPGLLLAKQVLTAHREEAEDLDFLKQNLDLEQGPLSEDAARITPDQALDALMILRFFKGHALAGAPPLAPARGSITRIITTQPDESKRLKTLLKTQMRDILSDVGISPHNPDPEDIQLIRHAGAEASRADTVR